MPRTATATPTTKTTMAPTNGTAAKVALNAKKFTKRAPKMKAPRGALQEALIAHVKGHPSGTSMKDFRLTGSLVGSSPKSVEQCVGRLVRKGTFARTENGYVLTDGTAKATKKVAVDRMAKARAAKKTKVQAAPVKAKRKYTKRAKAPAATVTTPAPTSPVSVELQLAQAVAALDTELAKLPAEQRTRVEALAAMIANGSITVVSR